jgi:putative copper export protein
MSLALILMRWLHLSASILLASLFLFEAAILFPAVRKPTTEIGYHQIYRLTCRAALWTLGFGAWNLFLLKPRLAVDLPNMNVADQKSAIRSLVRNVLCEVGLGTAVIVIVAALGITPSPLH